MDIVAVRHNDPDRRNVGGRVVHRRGRGHRPRRDLVLHEVVQVVVAVAHLGLDDDLVAVVVFVILSPALNQGCLFSVSNDGADCFADNQISGSVKTVWQFVNHI